jgi:hypothetical protein
MNDKVENDKVEKDTSKFDWVTKRSLCSLPNVFKALRLQVEEDVKIRNAPIIPLMSSLWQRMATTFRFC